ncbi:gamma-glutamyl-gamma-aminobutyrate hydrolase family protein [Cryptosporangium sp. NPDC051539]|uniref:gamma-glutamyl-gamma-aminobutyrate hydrolase family protein n=1 Tax=Cryptosporangium sp. NPDC051539 TaxID=3363962 RepID=UPI00379C4C47
MTRPLIAIPARFSATTSALRYEAEVTARALAESVFEAGGEPLSMHPSAAGGAAGRLGFCQGVLLPGGGDLASPDPDPHPSLYDVDPAQDAFDLAVARHCLATGVPLLAICRGLQVVNVARGGRLLPDMLAHHRHVRHTVTIEPGSALSGLLGAKVEASCFHHQCLSSLGRRMRAVAHAEDGTIEGVEIDGLPGWFLGVQWHPEDTWQADLAIFRALVAQSRASVDPPFHSTPT